MAVGRTLADERFPDGRLLKEWLPALRLLDEERLVIGRLLVE